MVKELAASRRMKRSEAAASCTEVNTIAIELTTLVMNSPASPQILVLSDTIIASRNVVCTEAEKVSLSELDAMFEEAVARLETAKISFQQQLETITGGGLIPRPQRSSILRKFLEK